MVRFVFAVHNHQPAGNFEHVMEEGYKLAYLPFIETLKKYPDISVSMHFSGILYDYLEKRHPEYLNVLREMSKAERMEIIGGAYYEPVLAVIPGHDQTGQIKMMREYIQNKFGRIPSGAWLAERVWEPQLCGVLADAGVKYTILDDSHFFSAGLEEKNLTGYFSTEFQGQSVYVFPINHKLRYFIPFSEPEKTIEYFKSFQDSDAVLVMADDGEKFGMWPQTHDSVYKKKWLDRFFDLLLSNSSWIKTCTFSECIKSSSPKGLVYMQTGSYFELSQWSLPAEASVNLARIRRNASPDTRTFLKGGYFRNFFSKYPQSNRMYRKMLRVSERLRLLQEKGMNIDEGLKNLWKAQCNCAYWHGVFGGIYLPHIRMEVYKNLIAAEVFMDNLCSALSQNALPQGTGINAGNIPFSKTGSNAPCEETARKGGAYRVYEEDWDHDGQNEFFVESGNANFYISPFKGGGLWEWDFKPNKINRLSVISRHLESYHKESESKTICLEKQDKGIQDWKNKIFYDWHLRMCLLDHFLHPDTRLEDFYRVTYGEQGDFVLGNYNVASREDADGFHVLLSRNGSVWIGDRKADIKVEKSLVLKTDGCWSARYCVQNQSGFAVQLWFGAELVFAFSNQEICPMSEENSVTEKAFNDPVYGNIKLNLNKHMNLWSFPLETVSMSEEGIEKTYQGSVLLVHEKMELKPSENFSFGFDITTKKL